MVHVRSLTIAEYWPQKVVESKNSVMLWPISSQTIYFSFFKWLCAKYLLHAQSWAVETEWNQLSRQMVHLNLFNLAEIRLICGVVLGNQLSSVNHGAEEINAKVHTPFWTLYIYSSVNTYIKINLINIVQSMLFLRLSSKLKHDFTQKSNSEGH